MAYDVSNIIKINTSIRPSGIQTANFASALLFAPSSDNTGTAIPDDGYRAFSNLNDVDDYFPTTTETYKAAAAWLGGLPATNQITIYVRASADPDWTTTLNKARNQLWWFWTFVTKPVYDEASPFTNLAAIANWCNDNSSMFVNCQSDPANVNPIRTPATTDDIASTFTASGYRFAYTLANESGGADSSNYAGIRLAKWYAAVNYNALASTITGEYKVMSGVTAESLTVSEYNAMLQDTKKCVFYSSVDLRGQTDAGRVINSMSHSSFGEWIDDVINLEAFINTLRVSLYNTLANQTRKLSYTPAGFQSILTAAQAVGEQYIENNYLGPQNYINPDTGEPAFTRGYEILTQAGEILDASDAERNSRTAPPVVMRIFPAGAIHIVNVSLEVF